ncbi:MAG: aminotransferase class IV [Planctomycetota bacterium]
MTDGRHECWAWSEGEVRPAAEASVSCLDRGLQYGDGVFETLRAEGGSAFFIKAHLARLRSGLEALRIDCPEACDLAREGVRAVLGKLGDATGTIKITATRGVGPAGPRIRGDYRASVIVTGRADAGDRPQRLSAVVSQVVRNERSPLTRIKSLNYLEMVLARAGAADAGADEAIVLNTAGRVAEASSANVFASVDGRLVTPPVDEGCLPGIVRAEVIGLARASGADCLEGPLELDDLGRAEEAFLTNSRIGVAALVELDGRPLGDGGEGTLTGRLRAAFREAERRCSR